MNQQMLQKVKELELEILKYIDRLCKENGLNYYLIGGTLLGAIRHKGFIPWDDDIDIVMFRSDYNKFIEIAKKNNQSRYFVQNYATDPNYTRYITKVRLNETRFVEKLVADLEMHHGIFVDIFPLDKIQTDKHSIIDLRVKMAAKIIRIQNIKAGLVSGSSNGKTVRNKIINTLVSKVPSKVFSILLDAIYGCSNHKNTNFVTNFSSQYGWRRQTFPIETYGNGVPIEFEGEQFIAPSNWERILESLYGDYMKLPPVGKRNSGHDIIEIDLGPYK